MAGRSTCRSRVKTRIGIDDQDSYGFLARLVEAVAAAGCGTLILHARKALLAGLNPKQNREIPPLRYDVVHRVKHDFPGAEVVVNGGIRTLEQARAQLAEVDGVMIGREAYQNPYVPRRLGAGRFSARRTSAEPRARSSSACCPMSSASWPRARRSRRSPATSSACSTACPARAPGAATCPRRRIAPAPAPR